MRAKDTGTTGYLVVAFSFSKKIVTVKSVAFCPSKNLTIQTSVTILTSHYADVAARTQNRASSIGR